MMSWNWAEMQRIDPLGVEHSSAMPVGTSNKAQNDVIRKKGAASKKEMTDEDIEFKKKQAEEKKAMAAAAKSMGKKK